MAAVSDERGEIFHQSIPTKFHKLERLAVEMESKCVG
jgi:hypothetical protein